MCIVGLQRSQNSINSSTDSHGCGKAQETLLSPEEALFLHLIWAKNNCGDIRAAMSYGKVPLDMALLFLANLTQDTCGLLSRASKHGGGSFLRCTF